LLVAAFALSRMQKQARPALAVAVGATVAWACGQGLLRLLGIRILMSPTVNPGGFDPAHVFAGVPAALHGVGWLISGSWYGADLAWPLRGLQLTAGFAVAAAPPLALYLEIRKRRGNGGNEARVAYAAFWSAVDVLVIAAYGGLALDTSAEHARYLIPCVLAAAACVPLLAAGRRRGFAVSAAAAAWAVTAAIGLMTVPAGNFAGRYAPTEATRIVNDLQREGLARGYADYWLSHPLTWLSAERVHVYPVDEHCAAAAATLCAYAISDPAWYQALGGRTFLIVRSNYRCVNQEPRALLGRAQRVIHGDANTTIVTYDYDIATRLSADNNQGCLP